MYYLLFSVHELSDETRPDAHSVTTEVETMEGNYTVDDSNYNECAHCTLVNVGHLLKNQAQKHDKRCMYYL